MVVHYPRTVWKNSYAAEYEVTGKTYSYKKKELGPIWECCLGLPLYFIREIEVIAIMKGGKTGFDPLKAEGKGLPYLGGRVLKT